MAYYKGAARSSARGGRTAGKRQPAHSTSPVQNPAMPADLPIRLKGNRSATLHDTGLPCPTLPIHEVQEIQEDSLLMADLEHFIRNNRDSFLHLRIPLLTRAYVPRPGDQIVRILCVSEEVGCAGIKILLPCRLDLKPGSALAMELFIPGRGNPVPVRGVVSKISHTAAEDIVRYVIEVRFGPLTADALRDIARFVHATQSEAHSAMPA